MGAWESPWLKRSLRLLDTSSPGCRMVWPNTNHQAVNHLQLPALWMEWQSRVTNTTDFSGDLWSQGPSCYAVPRHYGCKNPRLNHKRDQDKLQPVVTPTVSPIKSCSIAPLLNWLFRLELQQWIRSLMWSDYLQEILTIWWGGAPWHLLDISYTKKLKTD